MLFSVGRLGNIVDPGILPSMVTWLVNRGTCNATDRSRDVVVLRAGKGAVYSYDAIGSHERSGYAVQGSGKDLIQPVLDNQLKAASPLVLPPEVRTPHLLPHLWWRSTSLKLSVNVGLHVVC